MSSSPQFKEWLGEVVQTPQGEAAWLDLLSQLEYVGCRKILKAVPWHQVDEEILRHVAEEASHAQLLKDCAAALGRSGASWTTNPFAAAGWRYFKDLDAGVSALSEGGHYPAVSWAIERRVMRVYPLYLSLTPRPAVKEAVQFILAQEKRHAVQFDGVPEAIQGPALALEEQLWDRLQKELQGALGAALEGTAAPQN